MVAMARVRGQECDLQQGDALAFSLTKSWSEVFTVEIMCFAVTPQQFSVCTGFIWPPAGSVCCQNSTCSNACSTVLCSLLVAAHLQPSATAHSGVLHGRSWAGMVWFSKKESILWSSPYQCLLTWQLQRTICICCFRPCLVRPSTLLIGTASTATQQDCLSLQQHCLIPRGLNHTSSSCFQKPRAD